MQIDRQRDAKWDAEWGGYYDVIVAEGKGGVIIIYYLQLRKTRPNWILAPLRAATMETFRPVTIQG